MKKIVIFISILIMASSSWLLTKNSLFNQPGKLGDYRPITVIGVYGEKITTSPQAICASLVNRMTNYADWQMLWVTLLFAIIAYPKRAKKNMFLISIIAVDLGMIFYIFGHYTYFPSLIDGTLVQRVVMHFAPIAVFVTALLLGEEK